MDRSEFDRLARLFAGAATRRAGLKAVVGGLLGAGGLATAGLDANATKNANGDGASGEKCTPKKKRCSADKECCTKHCRKKKGKAGRCRCIRKGKACTAGQTCCKKLTCSKGTCQPKTPAPTPTPPPPACTNKMVCASGCTYQTVQAAIDALQNETTMQTVVIGAGEYVEDLTVTGKIELAACPGEEVILRNATADANRARTILMPEPTGGAAAPELVLTDIVITAKQPLDATYGGGGIMAFGTLTLNGATTVKECSSDSYDSYGGGIHLGKDAVLMMNGTSSVKDNYAVSGGGGIMMDSYATVTMNDDATVSGNSADSDGGGIRVYGEDSPIVLNDRSSISGNKALDSSFGGGVWMGYETTLTMNDDSVMSGNSAEGSGRGGAVFSQLYSGEAVTVIMTGNSRMENNTAELGGAVYLDRSTQLTMAGTSTMTGNTATVNGGAVYMNCVASTFPVNNNYTIVTLSENATITGNTAVEGGAIFGDLEYSASGIPGKVVAPAGAITGNTPSTDQCKGTDKPTCV